MLNSVYQLVRPRQFETAFTDLTMDRTHVIVRPTHLSICNADQRYYQGKRAEEVLREKLPMALIHEGIGRVVYDPTGQFACGDKVIMIPDEPARSDEEGHLAAPERERQVIAENYLRSSRFRGSSIDGFMQEYVQTWPDRLVRVPGTMNNDLVAAFTEMVSVCYHAVTRFDQTAHSLRDRIGVWGDGNMGYFTALMLRARFPQVHLTVFGKTQEKLSNFTFADDVCPVSRIPDSLEVDHAFECVGGAASGQVISQVIDHIRPEGTLALLGVSEEPVPVYTRMVLEKGLRLIGTSRSGREDFSGLAALYEQRPDVVAYLDTMVGAVCTIRGIPDMRNAFETDIRKMVGKTIMIWN